MSLMNSKTFSKRSAAGLNQSVPREKFGHSMLLYQNDLETQQSNLNEVSVIISQADIIATVPEVYEPSQKFTLFMSRDDLRSVEEI